MIKEYVEQWEKNKHKLEEYFRTNTQDKYSEYSQIVRKIFQLVITEYNSHIGFDINRMTIIDNGDYQGTKIFIIPAKMYQPSVDNYVITNTYYGSCSGCDTLQAISRYDYNYPTDKQVKEYMTLALHLVQKLKMLS